MSDTKDVLELIYKALEKQDERLHKIENSVNGLTIALSTFHEDVRKQMERITLDVSTLRSNYNALRTRLNEIEKGLSNSGGP